ncbi:hypothetical protein PHMEG_00037513 [Phytophthora megakarya]|uniref:Uncharacterized protein n=1 Tax=Phytophthora megakarya TaxID=4795 RepID=A0A225UJ87_9STRA|nr:hypothetical protein PHMEG_00037513 [Phytophthora megakarya]
MTMPRIRVSAISELKEYSGKDHDEDRARSWLGKVKSAFVRDLAPESEKMSGTGRNIANEEYLSRDGITTRRNDHKVKSAFVRDQAPDSEKYLVLGDLLMEPARNWYRQLSRSTRSNW